EFYSYKFQVFDVDNRKVVKKVISKPSWLNYNLKTGELSGVAEIGSRNYVELLVDDKKSIIKKSFFINVTGSKKNIKASKKVQKEPLIKKSSWQQIPKVEKIQLERHYFVLNSQSIVYSDKDKTSYAQKWPLNRLVAGSYDGQWIKVTKYLTSLGWNRVNGSRYIPIDNIQKDYFKYQTIKEVEVKSKAGKYLTKWPQGKIFFGRNKEGTIQVNKSFENGKWLTYKEVIKVSKESSKEIE
ncbi:MAG: hypothetical protein OIF32_03070, partial [Campylobacterales bacterium]|nr:hypothetical protein [Campylobacterales bacterium]